MEPILQKDPRWTDVEIVPGVTLGNGGCLLCCICMANHVLGNIIYPDQLCEELKKVGGFDPKGNLLWAKLQYTSSIVWMWYPKTESGSLSQVAIWECYKIHGKGTHFLCAFSDGVYNPNPKVATGDRASTRLLAKIPKESK